MPMTGTAVTAYASSFRIGLLITTPSPVVTLAIARHARHLRPDLPIIARAESEELAEDLRDLGVHEVVLPQMEAGLEVTRQALLHLKVPDQQIERFADEVRRELYRPLRGASENGLGGVG